MTSLKKLSWFPPKLPPYNLLEYKERLPADYQLITNHWRHSKNFLGFHLNFLHITCYNTKKDYLGIINWSYKLTSLKKLSWFPPKLPPYNLLQYKERLPVDYQVITNHWRHSKNFLSFQLNFLHITCYNTKKDYLRIINWSYKLTSLKRLSWFPPKLPPYNLLQYKERLPADYQLIINHWGHSKNFLGFHLNFLHTTCYNTKKDYLRIINWS